MKTPWSEDGNSIDGVLIETEDEPVGWAVYSGIDGEVPTFVAYFADEKRAEEYIAAVTADSDADWWMCDPGMVPAAIEGGRIFAANHGRDEESRPALEKATAYERALRTTQATAKENE
jgi:hypothetical protein